MRKTATALVATILLSMNVAAGPATMPASQQDTQSYPALQSLLTKLKTENTTLKQQLEGLQRENADLKAKLQSQAETKTAKADAPRKVKKGDELQVGMTLEEVCMALFGTKDYVDYYVASKTEDETSKSIVFGIDGQHIAVGTQTVQQPGELISVTFSKQTGKLLRFRRSAA